MATEKDDHNASDITLAKNIEVEFEKVVAKMACGVEKDTPHLLLRAVFGRKSLAHLKSGDKDAYLKIMKEAIDIAREHNQDVIDTAVELFLKRTKAERSPESRPGRHEYFLRIKINTNWIVVLLIYKIIYNNII